MKKITSALLLFFFVVTLTGDASASPNANIFDADILAYHTYLMEMTPLDPQSPNDGLPMPSALFIAPGRYKAYGQTFDMNEPGLYRFFSYVDATTTQRVVYTQSDPMSVISSVMWFSTQSYADNGLSMQQLTEKAKTDKLRISCGIIVDYIAWLMPQLFGIPARYAGAITQQPWHYINDGHAMVEIYLNNKWVVFDPAFNTRFWLNGEPLSLLEVSENLENVDIEYLTFDTPYDVTGMWYEGHSFNAIIEPIMSPALLRDYYDRMLDSLIIREEGKYYYYDSGGHDDFFLARGWFKLTEAEWMSRLYP